MLLVFVATGDELQYLVPNFPMYKPILKEAKLQWEDANGTIHMFEGFAHPSNLLDQTI